MKDLVYKFLDSYAGDGIVVEQEAKRYNPFTFSPEYGFTILKTNSGVKVIRIKQLTLEPLVRIELTICKTVSIFFSITESDSQKYIIDWFYKKNGIKYRHELIKYLPI